MVGRNSSKRSLFFTTKHAKNTKLKNAFFSFVNFVPFVVSGEFRITYQPCKTVP